MNFIESIDFVEYIPITSPRGLFSKRNPLMYKGNQVKSLDLVDILSLLNPDATNKYTTYIMKDKIRVDEDKEELMSLLPKTEINMIEIYKEYPYYKYKKSKYMEEVGGMKSYLFYMYDEYRPYAVVLFLLFTGRLKDTPQNLLMIIEGICYGYPKESIKGFYITKENPLNLFSCIQGRNVTKRERDLLYEELKEFEASEIYVKLNNKFEEDYSKAEDIIDKIISDSKFKGHVKDMKQLEQKCTPDYIIV
jgi:hypothetical protein